MGVGAVMAVQAVGGATSAYGAYQQGLAQSNYYKYLATNSRQQADLVKKQGDLQATMAENAGAEESKMQQRKGSQLEGAQAAAIGANMGSGSGTAADIVTDTFNQEKLDSMAIKYNADLKAWTAENDATNRAWALNREAGGYDIAAAGAKANGKQAAFNDLLGSAGQVASTWYMNKFYSPTNGTARIFDKSGTRRVPVAPPNYWRNNGG